jgi:hypothetical protein
MAPCSLVESYISFGGMYCVLSESWKFIAEDKGSMWHYTFNNFLTEYTVLYFGEMQS